MFTIDELSLPRLKDLAVGIPGAQEWVNDLPNAANKKFVADYIAKYKLHGRRSTARRPMTRCR